MEVASYLCPAPFAAGVSFSAMNRASPQLLVNLMFAGWSESEQRMRAIWETAAEGIITIDERGIVELLNPAACHIFGYQPEEVIGQNVKMLMPSPYRDNHDGYLANYLRTGHAKMIGIGREVVGQRKDGSLFPMELSVGEVRLGDRRLFTGLVRDISERRRLERF